MSECARVIPGDPLEMLHALSQQQRHADVCEVFSAGEEHGSLHVRLRENISPGPRTT